ncbi:MAG: SAM-dependent methyltransferase [Hyphomicrobium sp.]|nr:SAM-dependent methyltransferase [Hyphomicrobium sp.]
MTSGGDKDTFLAGFEASISAGTFVRLTLGKYRGAGDAEKIVLTPVAIKGAAMLKAVTSHARKDVTQNYAVEDAVTFVEKVLGADYLSATLFTTAEDVTLGYTKKKTTTLTRGKPTFSSVPVAEHNRAKQYIVDASRPYLAGLGVSDGKGAIKPSMYAKFKQICHFVEIVESLISESDVRDASALRVTDIGSGKGYLTFALYDHLAAKPGRQASVTGIEIRPELVALCNDLAVKSGFSGLTFEAVAAAQSAPRANDIMIALHACDTATDDAIYQGIKGNAALIVTAPCCQHELAPQLTRAVKPLDGLLKFGLFKQRQADLVTDAARCLLLEAQGYTVKVIEFVSTEHTAKNILIAAIRDARVDRTQAQKQYAALKAQMGFTSQHLETLLSKQP